MLRIDRSVTPTMAKTPTLAQWELDRLRTIEHVVRRGRIQHADSTRLVFSEGEVATAKGAVIVHCAASGLRYPPLQSIRTRFPCFGAAQAGYVEATRDDEEEKNRLCPSSPFSNTPADWALEFRRSDSSLGDSLGCRLALTSFAELAASGESGSTNGGGTILGRGAERLVASARLDPAHTTSACHDPVNEAG